MWSQTFNPLATEQGLGRGAMLALGIAAVVWLVQEAGTDDVASAFERAAPWIVVCGEAVTGARVSRVRTVAASIAPSARSRSAACKRANWLFSRRCFLLCPWNSAAVA